MRCQGDPACGLISSYAIYSFCHFLYPYLSCEELQPIVVYTERMTGGHPCDYALALPFLSWLLLVTVLLISFWYVTHQMEAGAHEASASQLQVPGLRY